MCLNVFRTKIAVRSELKGLCMGSLCKRIRFGEGFLYDGGFVEGFMFPMSWLSHSIKTVL